MTSFSTNLGIPETDPAQNQKEVTQNNAVDWLDNALNATLAIVFTANARLLTAAEFTKALRFRCGALTAAGTLTVPLTSRLFVVDNATSGWTLTVKGATGATVLLPAGVIGILCCDGASCILLASSVAGVSSSPRNKGELQAQFVLGTVASNGLFYFTFKAPYPGTIFSLDTVSGVGTFTLDVKINGTDVTGLAAVAVTAAAVTTPATGANVFAAGDTITGTISIAAGAPTNAVLNLNVIWS